jgi:hypothetical protein
VKQSSTCLTLEDGTDILSQNAGNKLLVCALKEPIRAISFTLWWKPEITHNLVLSQSNTPHIIPAQSIILFILHLPVACVSSQFLICPADLLHVCNVAVDSMPNHRLARLVQNLTHIVCHQLDAPEAAVEMPIESISPWILLQQILQR